MNADWAIMRNLEGKGFLSDTGEPIFNWIDKYIYLDDRVKIDTAIDKAIANKSIFEEEYRMVSPDGILGWTSSRAIPILDNQNNITEWFGAASDIT
mgnify:FL=1